MKSMLNERVNYLYKATLNRFVMFNKGGDFRHNFSTSEYAFFCSNPTIKTVFYLI